MKYKTILLLFILFACSPQLITLNKKEPYAGNGFAYIYNEIDFNEKIIKGKMNNDVFQISHQNLKTGTLIKILNPKNKESLVLKNIEDSFASAANYLKTIGWKKNQPCFFKIELKDNVPKKFLNSSARNIKNKRKISFLKKYIKNFEDLNINDNLSAAIIIPDKDIIPEAETLSPAYLIFDNYEKILNWNRSLRFSLAVCTLKERFENEI